jgi:hypothetical protein
MKIKIDCEDMYFEFNEVINKVVNKYYEDSLKKIDKETLYEEVEDYLKKFYSDDILTAIFCNLSFEIEEDILISHLTKTFRHKQEA